MLSLTVAGTVNTANIDISNVCSCLLISRQGLYLKLTLSADVDIFAESDNPTHYADGFHCNFEEFIFHRFLAEQALEFFNLLHGGSKFRGRNNLLSGGDSSKTSFLVLLTPEK